MQQESRPRKPFKDETPLPQWEDELTDGILAGLSGASPRPEDIQDLLRSIPDRADLERLFEKNVTIAQIVQLLGRNVDRQGIQQLIDASDVQAEIRRLLASTAEPSL